MNRNKKAGKPDEFARVDRAARFLLSKIKYPPNVAVVLGSGLGGFGEKLTEKLVVPYSDVPGFPRCSAEGHAGRLLIGKIAGTPVIVLQGRVHLYEGHPPCDVVFPMRVLSRLGVRAVVLTNAAGGINAKLKVGDLVVVSDHINLQGANPLAGRNDERFGPRFFDMTQAYDRRFQEIAFGEARRLGMELPRGVYAALLGPSYETPAEIGYLRTIGADLVGMSTVPEVIAARHMGIRVLTLSLVTNAAAGLSQQEIDYKEVFEVGEHAQSRLVSLLSAVMPRITAELAATSEGSAKAAAGRDERKS